MFTPIDLTALPPDVSREEREYFDYFCKDTENPAKRHRIPIMGEVDGKRTPGFFEEPVEAALLAAASELLPIWSRSQVTPVCTCASRYYAALSTRQTLQSVTTSLQFNEAALQAIKADERITRAVYQRLKPLKDQVFLLHEEVQEAVFQILLDVLPSTDTLQETGLAIVAHLKTFGMDEAYRQRRLQEQQTILEMFAGVPPVRPWPPTREPCPFCHLPYRYAFVEWIPFELPALSRAMELLVGVHVPLTELPRILEALELWVFTSDAHLFAKKKGGTPTIVGAAMAAILTTLTTLKDAWIEQLGSLPGTASAATATSSSVLDGPPPSVPPSSPDAN